LLLEGDPKGVSEAFGRLCTSAGQGDADAASLLATLHAAGAWTPPDWPQALNWLARAADMGSEPARDQLDLLAPPGRSWAERARSTGMERLLGCANRVVLSDRPRVRLAEGFIDPAMCDWLTGLVRNRMERGRMGLNYDIAGWVSPERTNSVFMFTVFDADCIVALVRMRIATLLKLPGAHMEPPQMFHYATGQELAPHVDYYRRDDRAPGVDYQGDRIASFLLYLNDGFEGGETEFLRPGLKVKPRKGGAVYFANVGDDGRPDPQTLHAGRRVTAGEKWLLSQWIHDRPFTGRGPG
jgi:hypothetical protein